MKNYMKKVLSFFGLEDDEFDDYELYNNYNEEYNYIDIPEELTEEDKKYKFPITKNHAIDIAYRDENLKTDFFRRRRDCFNTFQKSRRNNAGSGNTGRFGERTALGCVVE